MAKAEKAERSKTREYYELWGPSAIFVSFVLIGCFYIVMAKAHGYQQFLVTFVPVALMLVYATVMALSRFLRLRDDQAGDNLYYMGFLFTLTSLGTSLYHFTADRNADYIVQNFGIAIASTITGIALRVLFNQMRRDPAEVEHQARIELAEAARRVRIELDHTVLEFDHFRRASLQSLREGFDEIAIQVDKVGERLLAGLEEVTQKSAAPLEAASKSSGQTIEGLTKRVVAALEDSANKLAEENRKLSGSANAIASSLDDVKERLASMQAPDEVIKIKLDPTIKGLASAVDRFTGRIDQHEKVFGSALESARLSSEATREAVDRIRITTTDSEAGIREVVGSLKDTIQSLASVAKAQAEQVDGVMKRSDETLSVIRDMGSSGKERDAHLMEALSVIKEIGTSANERDARLMEMLSALKDLGTAASERDARHMETLSKLMPTISKGDNVIELTTAKEPPAAASEQPKRSLWSFGTNP